MKPKIIVVGSANTDMIVRVPVIPKEGQTVLGHQFDKAHGGKGANQAVAAARLGAEVTFIARVGNDALGAEAIDAYRAEGICVDYIIRDPESPTGVALIMVNFSGENIIAVAPGANSRLCPDDILAAEAAFQEADCLLLQLEIPLITVQAAANLAHKYHVKVILNPAPAGVLPDQLLENVDVLTPNEHEANLLTSESPTDTEIGESGQQKLNQRLMQFGNKILVITQGARGATWINDQGTKELVPGFSVNVVDTTAAGDSFNGALAVAIAQGLEMPKAIRFANAVGALTATRIGAQPSLPYAEDVSRFLIIN